MAEWMDIDVCMKGASPIAIHYFNGAIQGHWLRQCALLALDNTGPLMPSLHCRCDFTTLWQRIGARCEAGTNAVAVGPTLNQQRLQSGGTNTTYWANMGD